MNQIMITIKELRFINTFNDIGHRYLYLFRKFSFVVLKR